MRLSDIKNRPITAPSEKHVGDRMQKFWMMWERVAHLKYYWRWLLKCCVFVIVLFFILNPNPWLFIQQLYIYANVEQLIQTDFEGLEEINREIDARLAPNATKIEEFKAVERYVYEKIPYAYDWDNWGNLDYWPSAEQTLKRGREDCDGRAVLAASILRSRGFTEATLAGNLRHIWVTIGKDGLMSPDKEQNLQRRNGKTTVTLPSLSLILQNFAIYWADFPVTRNLLLFFIALVLVYHPRRELTPFLGMVIAVLIGYLLLQNWARATLRADHVVFSANLVIGAACMIGALFYAPVQCLSCINFLTVIHDKNIHAEKLQTCATKALSTIYSKGDPDGRATGTAAATPTK